MTGIPVWTAAVCFRSYLKSFFTAPGKKYFFCNLLKARDVVTSKLIRRMKMTEFLKILVTLIIAVPFVYMFYDVTKELLKKLYIMVTRKAKPAFISIMSIFSS